MQNDNNRMIITKPGLIPYWSPM